MEDNASAPTSNEEYILKEIQNLLWGPNIRPDVFGRWSQGFEFSDVEPSALVQKQGGPCAVIAPVQAFLLKGLLTENPENSPAELNLYPDTCRRLLTQALCDILEKSSELLFRIAIIKANDGTQDVEGNINDSFAEGSAKDPPNACVEIPEWTPEQFHERLTVITLEAVEEVEIYYTANYKMLTGKYGVLLFMYSVILTKGICNVSSELSDTSEPLIHNTYGYGSQALINLMLTGRAVAHVWDNDQDVGGLRLPGIIEQADVGFITLMEQMRYCTVGSFFKNPKNPVWVMGSETHLTVLFSNEKRLVSPETPSETARRVFKSFDPDGNNFIQSMVLQDVLCTLDLVSDPEYVDIMRKKLDPEGLGIILLDAFMEEFFSEEQRSVPDTFDLLHYNGIPGSNTGNKVKYSKGTAILLESDLRSVCTSNPMLTCLQTKWPNIEVTWQDTQLPSLN